MKYACSKVLITVYMYIHVCILAQPHCFFQLDKTHSLTSAPSSAPGNVKVIRLNGTAMNVSWSPLNLVEARGFVQSYIITYQQASNVSRRRRQLQNMTQQVDGRASSAIVGGLEPGVAYEVSIAGMTTENGPGELQLLMELHCICQR